MAIRVQATFVFTEDGFENLSFEKKGDIIEKMLSHPDWDIELVEMEMDEVNMEDDWNIEYGEEADSSWLEKAVTKNPPMWGTVES